MENEFKLGPVQLAWVKALRDNPGKQGKGHLGRKYPSGNELLCCLGMGYKVSCELKNIKPEYDDRGFLRDGSGNTTYLYGSHRDLGLKDGLGSVHNVGGIVINGITHRHLGDANDHDVLWSDIADYIENNPSKIFTHSV